MFPLLCCAPVCLVIGFIFVAQVQGNNVDSQISAYNDAVLVRSRLHDAIHRCVVCHAFVFVLLLLVCVGWDGVCGTRAEVDNAAVPRSPVCSHIRMGVPRRRQARLVVLD